MEISIKETEISHTLKIPTTLWRKLSILADGANRGEGVSMSLMMVFLLDIVVKAVETLEEIKDLHDDREKGLEDIEAAIALARKAINARTGR